MRRFYSRESKNDAPPISESIRSFSRYDSELSPSGKNGAPTPVLFELPRQKVCWKRDHAQAHCVFQQGTVVANSSDHRRETLSILLDEGEDDLVDTKSYVRTSDREGNYERKLTMTSDEITIRITKLKNMSFAMIPQAIKLHRDAGIHEVSRSALTTYSPTTPLNNQVASYAQNEDRRRLP